jgi:hypothetical protein
MPHGKHQGGSAADGIPPESRPRLALVLDGLDRPALAQLRADDPLYPTAAWLYFHAGKIPSRSRRSLLEGLGHAWPRARGDLKRGEHRRLAALAMVERGASTADVAEAFSVARGTAAKWVRLARRETGAAEGEQRYREPGVYAVDPYDGALVRRRRLPGLEDPAGPLALAQSFVRSAAQLDDLHRAGLDGVRRPVLPNPLPTRVSRARPRNAKSPPKRAFLIEPTPGIEPGTPSLRVKCSTS